MRATTNVANNDALEVLRKLATNFKCVTKAMRYYKTSTCTQMREKTKRDFPLCPVCYARIEYRKIMENKIEQQIRVNNIRGVR